MKIDYKCTKCNAANCKLWRQYQTFLNHIELLCARCMLADQAESLIGDDGRLRRDLAGSDAIGWMVPAVPTAENDTFWGYTSVPEDRVRWWLALPTVIAANDTGD